MQKFAFPVGKASEQTHMASGLPSQLLKLLLHFVSIGVQTGFFTPFAIALNKTAFLPVRYYFVQFFAWQLCLPQSFWVVVISWTLFLDTATFLNSANSFEWRFLYRFQDLISLHSFPSSWEDSKQRTSALPSILQGLVLLVRNSLCARILFSSSN